MIRIVSGCFGMVRDGSGCSMFLALSPAVKTTGQFQAEREGQTLFHPTPRSSQLFETLANFLSTVCLKCGVSSIGSW